MIVLSVIFLIVIRILDRCIDFRNDYLKIFLWFNVEELLVSVDFFLRIYLNIFLDFIGEKKKILVFERKKVKCFCIRIIVFSFL